MSRNKAFTLIELLVVIAIIGILASVVVASVNVAREKGRIGAGKHFAAQVDHIAGELLVGKWDFDECISGAGTVIIDRSGYGNNGTIPAGPATSTDTPTGAGCSLLFSSNGGVSIPYTAGSVLDFNGSSNLTMSWWMKWSGNTASGVRLFEALSPGGWGIELTGSNGSARFNCFGSCGTGPVWPAAMSPDDRWHQYTGVYDGAEVFLYRDGVAIARGSYAAGWTNGAKTLVLGGDNSIYGYNGYMDAVRVYAKTLTASEVRNLYTLDLKANNLAEK